MPLFITNKVNTIEAELEPCRICSHVSGEAQEMGGEKLRKSPTPCILPICNLSRMLLVGFTFLDPPILSGKCIVSRFEWRNLQYSRRYEIPDVARFRKLQSHRRYNLPDDTGRSPKIHDSPSSKARDDTCSLLPSWRRSLRFLPSPSFQA